MNKSFFAFFFFFLLLQKIFALEENDKIDFITPMEYGKMLYINPRGISCASCHGSFGEGKEIAHYRAKGQARFLKAPKINEMSFENFLDSFNQTFQVMPKYHLTQEEIKAIYSYLVENKNSN